MQRLEQTPEVNEAALAGQFVVACAYNGRVPQEALELLPEGFNAQQFVARFDNGVLTALIRGKPEDVLKEMLADETAQGTRTEVAGGNDCTDCAECKDCKPQEPPAKP